MMSDDDDLQLLANSIWKMITKTVRVCFKSVSIRVCDW